MKQWSMLSDTCNIGPAHESIKYFYNNDTVGTGNIKYKWNYFRFERIL